MTSEARYVLLPTNEFEINPWLRVSFSKFSWFTVSVQFFAFMFCIIYSVLFHFTSATYTHCHVYNVLPSISAAIGNFSPQREVWQLATLIQAFPRFFVAYVYLQHHKKKLYPRDIYWGNLACFLNVLEIVALIILSFWTSSQYYPIHKNAFVTFIIMSELYMITTCILQARHRIANKTSLKLKRRLVMVNIACIFIAGYFFMRHNSFCEPYVYSVFAFMEYVVVLTNMAFHMTAAIDFRGKDLVVYRYGVALWER